MTHRTIFLAVTRVWCACLLLACGDDGGASDATVDGPRFDSALTDASIDSTLDSTADTVLDANLPDAMAPVDIDAIVMRLSNPAATEADLDALLIELGLGAGLPIGDGTRMLFVTRWDIATPVSLVGDINGWNEARTCTTTL